MRRYDRFRKGRVHKAITWQIATGVALMVIGALITRA